MAEWLELESKEIAISDSQAINVKRLAREGVEYYDVRKHWKSKNQLTYSPSSKGICLTADNWHKVIEDLKAIGLEL